jgi:hypothetical protein
LVGSFLDDLEQPGLLAQGRPQLLSGIARIGP